MKAYITFLFLIIIGTSIGQVTNVKAGVWSDSTGWSNNLIPTAAINITLSYDIVVDMNASCKSLRTNGHSVTIKTGVLLGISEVYLSADSTFTDPRDGEQYTYRHIGSQVWMTKNLNYAINTSKCYDDNATNCAIYGRLYTWDDAVLAVPEGWHLPTKEEWATLINFFGGNTMAGGSLKEAGTTHWHSPNTGATNISGFTGLPGGSFNPYEMSFGFPYLDTTWWSSTQTATSAWFSGVIYDTSNVYSNYEEKAWWFSVRCVRD